MQSGAGMIRRRGFRRRETPAASRRRADRREKPVCAGPRQACGDACRGGPTCGLVSGAAPAPSGDVSVEWLSGGLARGEGGEEGEEGVDDRYAVGSFKAEKWNTRR